MEILKDNYLNIGKEALEELIRGLKVLYVEDNLGTRELMREYLQDIFGEIFIASDGREGFEVFKKEKLDIIITDISMQDFDGLEMVEKIRAVNDDIPIFIVSAYDNSDFLIKSIKLGVDGYLIKPLDIDSFREGINRVVKRLIYKENIKNSLAFLEAYIEATDKSSIVSKTDPRGVITYVNDAFCKISGYSREELIGKCHNIVRYPDNPKELYEKMWEEIKIKKRPWRGVIRNMSKSGKSYYVDSLVAPILDRNGEIIEYISLRNDITDIMSPAKQLNEAMKNIPNPIIIYMKLDDFETMEEFYDNETLHSIQIGVGRDLEKIFKKIFQFDKLYHLESGEYAFVLNKSLCIGNKEYLIEKLKKIQKFIRKQEFEIGEHRYFFSFLFSIVYGGTKRFESAKLGIRKLIKERGFFSISNNLATIEQKKAKKNMRTIHMIKSALTDSRIVSFFQPIIDNRTKKIIKYESLVRLIDDNSQIILPSSFLETAKKSNLYFQITKEVLNHSFEKLNLYKVDISINLSAIDIEQDNIRELIFSLIKKHKKVAKNMVFELLEDEEVRDFEVVGDFIKKVKSFGVRIAIDDFGVGYSNYARLLKYQPDILKIDGSLIENIDNEDCFCLSALKSIVTFAKEQNIKTVAEFIEDETKFNIVRELGVDYSQGYYFGKPKPLITN